MEAFSGDQIRKALIFTIFINSQSELFMCQTDKRYDFFVTIFFVI